MALPSSQHIDVLTWQMPFNRSHSALADELCACFTAHRPYFNDIVRLNQSAPATSQTLHQWAQPAALTSLLACYSDHIYRNQPQLAREGKPLKSLWAQWYLGLLVPPLVMALVTQPRALDIDPQHIQVEFHETGRAATFWIEVHEDKMATTLPLTQRLEKLLIQGLMPVVDALEKSGEINGKLIWSNTGYLLNWFFGELRELLDEATIAALRHACFFEKQLRNGQDNPLYRTVIPREGLLVRRTCCQRYKLPDVQRCGDCTLK
ncbi:hydroxamate siderophore iron reductase FhuF [Buttiauxella warmboldiae]|uniref:Hydroxamate siderophore iron reductase FhuF n=1 Tax=Buttiauxella warmboldiae TaxID=82993 RepID=A0A3N5E426_9ENTR|nr:siderophore-iron reductase FhuF [Buttiauxella warmboldiae]RPH29779.1 hydroxamate siderophore iron reductase FhuF [Buttiauxella warmboldiae]